MRNRSTALKHDAERLSEVELCTILLDASSGPDPVLTRDDVDRLLGVRPQSPA